MQEQLPREGLLGLSLPSPLRGRAWGGQIRFRRICRTSGVFNDFNILRRYPVQIASKSCNGAKACKLS